MPRAVAADGAPEHGSEQRPWAGRNDLFALLALTAIAALTFAPALFGGFVYDDEQVIQRNAELQSGNLGALLTQPFFGEQSGYWRPVTMLTYWLGLQLGGAAAIHALAVMAHALAGWAGFLIARLVLGRVRAARAAFGVAVVFVVHPVQVESVAWCSAIPGVLAGMFSLLSIHAALRWQQGAAPAAWVAVWLLLALLSKEVALATVPILLLCSWPRRRRSGLPAGAACAAACAAAVGAWLLLRLWALPHANPIPAVAMDVASFATATELLGRQVVMLVWPWPLTPFHGFAQPSSRLWLLLWIVPVGLLLLLLLRRGPLIAPVILVLPLLPGAIMHRTVGDYPLAERHAYLSVFGFGLLFAPAVVGAARRWPASVALCGLALLAVAGWSCSQTLVWHDQRSLVAHGLHHAGEDALLHVMMGNLDLAAAQGGDAAALPRAFEHYEAARRLGANGARSKDQKAYARARLGLAWCEMLRQQQRNRIDAVGLIQLFEGALALRQQDASGWVGYGVANAIAGRSEEAERALRKALEVDPRCTEAWFNLGNLQANLGRPREARVSLRQALRCQPDLLPAQQLLERLR